MAWRTTGFKLGLDDLIDVHDADAGRAELGRAVGAGVRWIGPTQVSIQVIRVLTTYILSWLLLPEDFGIVALVTVLTGFFERVLGDTGTTTAIVRQPRLSQGLASSVLFWNLTVGAATTLVFVVGGTPIAHLLGQPTAGGLVRALGLVAIVNASAYVPRALFRRQLEFARLAAVNLTNAVVTGSASIALAIGGLDAWALVLGNLAGSVVATILAWVLLSWRPSMHYSRARLAEISGFSARLSLQNVFGYVSYAGDRFIIGRVLGTTELGYYSMANRFMLYPVQTAVQTYRQVVFPNLSRIQDDYAALTHAYQRSIGGIGLMLFPLCVTIAAVAEPLVALLLADTWQPVSTVLAPIALTAAIQSVAATTLSLYNVRGRTDLSLRWQIGSSIVLLILYLIGTNWGIEGVAWGYFIGTVLLTYPAFAIPLRLIGATVSSVLKETARTGLAALVGGALGYGTAGVVEGNGGSDLTQVLAGVGVSLCTYLAYIVIFRPPTLADLRRMLRR